MGNLFSERVLFMPQSKWQDFMRISAIADSALGSADCPVRYGCDLAGGRALVNGKSDGNIPACGHDFDVIFLKEE